VQRNSYWLSTKYVLASDQSSVRSWLVHPVKELSSAAGWCAGRGCALVRQLGVSLLFLGLHPRTALEILRSSCSNSTTFEVRTFSTDSKFDECFKRLVVECKYSWKNSCSTTDFVCTEQQNADKPVFFSNSTYHTNYSYWMCNIFLLNDVLHFTNMNTDFTG